MDHEVEFLKICEEQGSKFKSFCFGLKGAAKLFFYEGNATSSGIGLNQAQRPLRRRPSAESIFRRLLFDDPPSLIGTPQGFDSQSRTMINVKGQVIVDYGAWNRWGPGDEVPNMGDTTASPIDANTWLTSTIYKYSLHSIASRAFEDRCKDGNLLNDEYALLPPRLLGYIPVKRVFAQLAVRHLSGVNGENKDQVWNSD
ncbi:MAG: hypothetical protein Q9199_005105 [Rusavskia elegans]